MKETEAQFLADFLEKMLKWNPKDRPKAREMLSHPWIKMAPEYNAYMSREFAREWRQANGVESSSESSSNADE